MSEQKVYGVKACLALLTHRPEAVLRLYFRADRRPLLGQALAYLAEKRLPFRELDDEQLRKLATSTHHEGIVLATLPLTYRALGAEDLQPGLWVALDAVSNPHNGGGITRSASFFGARALIVGGVEPGATVNAAWLRTAEGGADAIPLFGETNLPAALALVRQAKFRIIGLETDGAPLANHLPAPANTVLVVGHEHHGLSKESRQVCDVIAGLPTSGAVGSLNVSAATAVALAALSGQFTQGGDRPAKPESGVAAGGKTSPKSL